MSKYDFEKKPNEPNYVGEKSSTPFNMKMRVDMREDLKLASKLLRISESAIVEKILDEELYQIIKRLKSTKRTG